MRTTTSPVALLALPALAYAVTLNDFTPRVQNLPAACSKVYNQVVAGCTPSDFPNCSGACVNGLAAMAQPVKDACGDAGISGQNIIVAFLGGSGPSSLCVDAEKFLGGSSSANAPPSSLSSSLPSTTPATSATSMVTTTSTTTKESSTLPASAASTSSESSEASTTAAAATTTTAAAASSSTSIVMDTSSSPIGSESATSTSSSSGSEQTSVSDHSGGGSPFDTLGNLRDQSAAAASLPALSCVLAAVIAATSLQW